MNADEIKHWLSHGDLKRLSEMFGIDRSTASKVLHGKVRRFDFLAALIAKANENRTLINSGLERLKQ
jgi:predicted XRE-type DNA-binding protein